MFMWIILAALTFGAVFDGLGAGRAIETLFIERWNLTPWGVLIMMQLSYILMGMFLDDTAMLVIVAPLYVPLIISLGFDPIWYGVLYTITFMRKALIKISRHLSRLEDATALKLKDIRNVTAVSLSHFC